MKKVLVLMLIILPLFQDTGCWSRKETETLAITTAIGIDRVDMGGRKMYRMSEHILLPRQLGAGPMRVGGGAGKQRAFWVATSLGQSVEGAGRNLATRVPRVMFLAHTRVIVFGEDVSREGLDEVLDFLTRYKEIRERSFILVTRGEAAKAMLAQPEMDRELAHETFGIETFARTQTPKVPQITLKEFGERMLTPGIDAWAPVFEVMTPPEKPSPEESPRQTVRVRGIAMFKTDRLAGWLGDRESQGVMIATGKVKQGDVTVNTGDRGQVTCIYRLPKVKTTVKISGEKINLTIKAGMEADVVETSPYPITDQEGIKAVERAINRQVEDWIRSAVEKSQAAGADILGVGRIIERKNHAFWDRNGDKWTELYPRVSVEVKVDTKVSRTGMRNKSFEAKLRGR